jgi:hypothetical protein
MSTKKSFGQYIQDFGLDVLQGVRNNIAAHEDEACFYERQNNIAIAAVAMRDAGLKDETIISMLQKYWDLRQSEAASFIDWAHMRIPEKLQAPKQAARAQVR